MMSMKKNKLSIVTALIVGTTMLSPLEKAWGMNDDEKRLSSSSSQITITPSSEDRLVGKTRVRADVCQAANNLLTALGETHDVKSLSVEGTPSRKAMRSLIQGGIGIVMAEQSSVDSSLPIDSLITNSLKAIMFAKEDPYNIVTYGVDKPAVSRKSRNLLKESLSGAKRRGASDLEGFLRSTLPHIVDSHPTIIDSLFARFPQDSGEIKSEGQQISQFKEYFGIQTPASSVSSKKPTQNQLQAQKRQQEQQLQAAQKKYYETLNELAEMVYFLQQIDKTWDPSKFSSSPSPAILLVEEEASAMMGGGASTSYDVAQEEAKVIAAPVPLRRALYNPPENVAITEENGVITVRTDNKGLHKYQLESERIPVTPGDRLKISYNITSSEDGIVLGLLKTHRNGWLPESKVALKQGNQQGTVEVKVPEGESLPFFVFYNDQTRTPSTEVTIHDLTIEKEEVKR
ncbi:MAG: hypothetical protein K2W92_06930 [Alphaproteobacteria bacterium]|nr:hypothetical protein [Alphaproteobacteria bacterium]